MTVLKAGKQWQRDGTSKEGGNILFASAHAYKFKTAWKHWQFQQSDSSTMHGRQAPADIYSLHPS